MRPHTALPLFAALMLAACGGDEGGGAGAPPAAPATPAASPGDPAEQARLQAALATLPAPYAEADPDNGRRVFARCRACHTLNEGGRNMTGPNLWGVFGRPAAAREDFNYSAALREAGFVWDPERLDHWLENPRAFLPGNRMAFAGVRDADDRRDLIAWLMIETGAAGDDAGGAGWGPAPTRPPAAGRWRCSRWPRRPRSSAPCSPANG